MLSEVNSVLQALLGATATQVLYSYLARNFKVKRDEIHSKPDSFLKGLTSLFGLGGRTIARTIAVHLKGKVPQRECKFVQALVRASK